MSGLNGDATVSVIIANFNHAAFLRQAIDSALALDWPKVEVIVVDDGSTDTSREIINSYGTRLRTLFQGNSTERVARNVGFELSTGSVIIHLDADDVLRPDILRRVSPEWAPGVSKVQVQMERIDSSGQILGAVFPDFRRAPSGATLRKWLVETSAYPTPPGSGNVYSRWFLDKICPVGSDCGDFFDSSSLVAAPLLGEVRTVVSPLVEYRVHIGNDSNLLARPGAFAREVQRAVARHRYSRTIAPHGLSIPATSLRKSRELLQLRCAALRRDRGVNVMPDDTIPRIIFDALRAPFHPGPESLVKRVAISAWVLGAALAPRRLLRPILKVRYGRGI